MMPPRADRWADALIAGALAEIDPAGLGGIWLRSRHSPVRDRWLAELRGRMAPETPYRRVAASIDQARLIGGLDFAATLAHGRPVMETGVLPACNGGVVTVAMAERLPPATAALIASALDRGAIRVEREGFSSELAARIVLVALDEGLDDEELPGVLRERLAFRVDLEGLRHAECRTAGPGREAIARARALYPFIALPDPIVLALTQAAGEAGRPSLRAGLFLCRAARAAAALRGEAVQVGVDDAVTALRLVLEVALSAGQEDPQVTPAPDPGPPEPPAPDQAGRSEAPAGPLADRILEAARATLPQGLLDLGVAADSRTARAPAGRSAEDAANGLRGRPVGVSSTRPAPDARIDLLATLRAAAPWQRVRGSALPAGAGAGPLKVQADDFRYLRRRQTRGTTAIFAVDASGSAAAARLAETKGAVELLLAECYVRRDEVALIAFRGTAAGIVLEPTRSLVRAKRALAGLPGGGPTPLAHGIAAATRLADALRRRGRRSVAVFLTDGRGNIGLDGRPGRAAAADDAAAAARLFRAQGLRGVVIDTAMRPQLPLRTLAGELGADYVALPHGGAQRISAELSVRLRS